MDKQIRVTVWHEGLDEGICEYARKLVPKETADQIIEHIKKQYAKAREIYPEGMNAQIAKVLFDRWYDDAATRSLATWIPVTTGSSRMDIDIQLPSA